MQVAVSNLEHLPENCLLSVRIGSVRRQAPVSVLRERSFLFPQTPFRAGETAKVDVLHQLTSQKVVLQNTEETYNIAFQEESGQTHGLQMHFTSMSERVGEVLSLEGDAGLEKKRRIKIDAATNAKDYLEQHEVLEYLQGLLAVLVQDKPADPYSFMWEQIGRTATAEPIGVVARESPQDVNVDMFKTQWTPTCSTRGTCSPLATEGYNSSWGRGGAGRFDTQLSCFAEDELLPDRVELLPDRAWSAPASVVLDPRPEETRDVKQRLKDFLETFAETGSLLRVLETLATADEEHCTALEEAMEVESLRKKLGEQLLRAFGDGSLDLAVQSASTLGATVSSTMEETTMRPNELQDEFRSSATPDDTQCGSEAGPGLERFRAAARNNFDALRRIVMQELGRAAEDGSLEAELLSSEREQTLKDLGHYLVDVVSRSCNSAVVQNCTENAVEADCPSVMDEQRLQEPAASWVGSPRSACSPQVEADRALVADEQESFQDGQLSEVPLEVSFEAPAGNASQVLNDQDSFLEHHSTDFQTDGTLAVQAEKRSSLLEIPDGGAHDSSILSDGSSKHAHLDFRPKDSCCSSDVGSERPPSVLEQQVRDYFSTGLRSGPGEEEVDRGCYSASGVDTAEESKLCCSTLPNGSMAVSLQPPLPHGQREEAHSASAIGYSQGSFQSCFDSAILSMQECLRLPHVLNGQTENHSHLASASDPGSATASLHPSFNVDWQLEDECPSKSGSLCEPAQQTNESFLGVELAAHAAAGCMALPPERDEDSGFEETQKIPDVVAAQAAAGCMAFLPEEDEDLKTQKSADVSRSHSGVNLSCLDDAFTAEEASVLRQYLHSLVGRIDQDLLQRETESQSFHQEELATIHHVREQLDKAAADGSLGAVLAAYPQNLVQEAEVLTQETEVLASEGEVLAWEQDQAAVLLVKEQLARSAADGSLDSALAGYAQSGVVQEVEVLASEVWAPLGQPLDAIEEHRIQRLVFEEAAGKQKNERLGGETSATEQIVTQETGREVTQLKTDTACLAAKVDEAERSSGAQELDYCPLAEQVEANRRAEEATAARAEVQRLVAVAEASKKEATQQTEEAEVARAAREAEANRRAEAATAARAEAQRLIAVAEASKKEATQQAEAAEVARAAREAEANRRAEAATAARAEAQRLIAVAEVNKKEAAQRAEAEYLIVEMDAARAPMIPAEEEAVIERTEGLRTSCIAEATPAERTEVELAAVTGARGAAKSQLEVLVDDSAVEVAIARAATTEALLQAATDELQGKRAEAFAAEQAKLVRTPPFAAAFAETKFESLASEGGSEQHSAEQQAESQCSGDEKVAALSAVESARTFRSQRPASALEPRRLDADRLVPRKPETKRLDTRRIPSRKGMLEEQDPSTMMVKERIVELRRRFQVLQKDHKQIHYKVGRLSTDMAHVRVQTEAALKILDRQLPTRS